MNAQAALANRIQQMGVSAIHEMTRLSKSVDDVAFLSWAKPTTDTPEHIKAGAIKAITDGLAGGYSAPLGLPALREAIAEKLHRDNQVEATAAEVLVSIGAIEGLAAAIMSFVDPGDEVLLPSPTYATHIRQVLLASGKPVLVACEEDQGFALDPDAIEAAITPKTKAIVFANPVNPTGDVLPEATLRKLADLAIKHDLILITDEAYEYFIFDEARHFSLASIPELKGRLVSCYTFTKTYAMTGWRVGYLHAAAELIPEIEKAHIPFAICAPVASQYAALAALQGPQDCIEAYRKKYEAARNRMCDRLDGLHEFMAYTKPLGSYLMFPKILTEEGQEDSLAFCKRLLFEGRVSTTPGIAFGPNGQGHVRMSFCVSEAVIDKAFDRLEAFFKG